MLTQVEQDVRDILIKVARGIFTTHHYRKITYKELWLSQYPNQTWGRGNTAEVVDWIVNISDQDTAKGLPPLNSIVVRKDTGEPGDSWDGWHRNAGSPFESQGHAQAACWAYWPTEAIITQYHA
ncbi:MAG: hypothetical protein MI747_02935 [Desulfobacterales bacterium]|nr:hypothetical protein [Desulfobacterales bacterium]